MLNIIFHSCQCILLNPTHWTFKKVENKQQAVAYLHIQQSQTPSVSNINSPFLVFTTTPKGNISIS